MTLVKLIFKIVLFFHFSMSRDKFNVKMNFLLIETEAEDYSAFNRNSTENIQGNSK